MAILYILARFIIDQCLRFFIVTAASVACADGVKIWYGEYNCDGENSAQAADGEEWQHETASLIEGSTHGWPKHVAQAEAGLSPRHYPGNL